MANDQREIKTIERMHKRLLQTCRPGEGLMSLTYPEKARQLSPAGWLSLVAVLEASPPC